MIEVKHHKGRSNCSVYAWRVYRVIHSGVNGARVIRKQLTKRRTREEAERDAEHFRAADRRNP